jgi:dTDP-4-amino-4,6-dideoxygalactose transaminase
MKAVGRGQLAVSSRKGESMGKLAINGGGKIRAKPFPDWPFFDEREVESLMEVCKSGVWGIGGAKVKEFEEKFANYQDAKYGICVMNGTAALEVSLKAAGVRYGDEVIIPPYTFIATATSAITIGAVPVFSDIESDTYNLDPDLIEDKITERTKAIIPVHVGGRPADLDGILRVAKKHGLSVIEDACQAPGAQWKGRKVGAIGDLGAISFQSSKNINAGEGGIVLTDDPELADLAWSYHNCGRAREGSWYEHHVLGWNYRMTEFQAAILLVQLTRLDEQSRLRQENGDYLSKLISEIDGLSPMRSDHRITRNAYHIYIFRYRKERWDGIPRDRFIAALQAEGIPCGPGYTPLYKGSAFLKGSSEYPALEKIDYSNVSCPVAEVASQEAVWMKQSMLLGSKDDMEDVAEAIRKVRENRKELLSKA